MEARPVDEKRAVLRTPWAAPEARREREAGAEPPLRIAQVAPLYEAVPPGAYGGTERVIATL
jgi:hypothetical protein